MFADYPIVALLMDFLQDPLFSTLFNHLQQPAVVVRADSPRFTIVFTKQ